MGKKIEYDERGAAPCKYCKRHGVVIYPRIDEVDEMYYARCPKCKHWDIYEFLALSVKNCIRVWNRTMEAKTEVSEIDDK